MAVKHDRSRLLNDLKKKIRLLQKNEEQARAKLQDAIKKIHQLAHEYKLKLALKKRVVANKIADVRKKSYVKIIEEIEDMMIKGIRTQGKVLTSTIEKLENKRAGAPKKRAKRKRRKK